MKQQIEQNLRGRIPLAFEKNLLAKVMRRGKDGKFFADKLMYEDDEVWGSNGSATTEENDNYVCCIWVDGAVTRDGGGCSYGSKDHRDIILECIEEETCEGILFYLDTPGGSSAAIADYKYAIDHARAKGLPVIAFVDGMAASCGMYIAALCDERYYMNPEDMVGSIGVYAAWFSHKDGDKDGDGYVYHERYDVDSYDKNKWARDANEGDYKLLDEDLKQTGIVFRADVKKACPNAKDEHLHGKMFPCSEVEGILVDGQKSFDECLARIDELFRASHKDNANGFSGANNKIANGGSFVSVKNLSVINIKNMDKKYVTIASLCGVQELHASEEGVFLNSPLVDNMVANLKQSREAYEAKVALAKQENEKALDAQKAEFEAKMAELQKSLDEKAAALADLQGKFDEQTSAIAGHADAIKAKDAVIAEREQTIADLQAKVAQLTNEPGAAPEAGASPQNNGAGVQESGLVCEAPQWDPSLSAQENHKRFEEYQKKLESMANA